MLVIVNFEVFCTIYFSTVSMIDINIVCVMKKGNTALLELVCVCVCAH